MLRFTNILLSNAEDSAISPLPVKAMVSDEPGCFIAPSIAQQLNLNPMVMPREIMQGGKKTMELTSCAGRVRIRSGEKELIAIADDCINGIIIGPDVTDALGIEVRPAATDKDGDSSHILIKENVVSADICRQFCEHTRTQELKPIGEKYRTTLMASLKGKEAWVNQLLCDLISEHIEPFYNLDMESWEPPQLLVYKEGGVYSPHADGAKWVKTGEGKGDGHWERFIDRDISFLLYLNDEFTGGKLNFPAQELKITPKPGLLVAFPSSAAYRHGAEKTESGERVVLVSWMTAFGTPRTAQTPITRVQKSGYAARRLGV